MYVYAFLKRSETALDLPEGLEGTLHVVAAETLAAVVETAIQPEMIQDGDDRFQLQAILSHDRVLRDVFQQTDVLPVPFGTFLISEEALINHLTTHQERYLAKLSQVKGKAEYTIKAEPIAFAMDDAQETQPARGKEYFLAKKRKFQQQEQHRQQQDDQFNQLQAEIAYAGYERVHSAPKDGIERIHILCKRTAEAALIEQFTAWQADCTHWTLLLGEALPPYHFV
jgi:hypothetical protein